MIQTSNLTLEFGGTSLFEDVSVKFLPGNCYGLIGANGAGKSTFLKLLSKELRPSSGDIILESRKRIAVLKQDQFAYDAYSVIETVFIGHSELYPIYKERNDLYAKDDLTDTEGERIGELESEFAELDGYSLEAEASTLLSDLGIPEDLHEKQMSELESGQKVRTLLAQALFGNPDILLLDEPTNQLDYVTVLWLEKFLMEFKNTVIIVSHDRHFLNKVCTHIADLDYKKIKLYVGNYDFWEKSSELASQQIKDQHKKQEDKVKELEAFIRRFSANASKSKQATSRKKLLEKIRPEDIVASSRRAPFIHFKQNRPCGDKIATIENISAEIDGEPVLKDVSFRIDKGDKIAIVSKNSLSKTALLDIISGSTAPKTGQIEWGSSISQNYFPKDNTEFFQKTDSLLDWLQNYSNVNDDQLIRGLLGRMLFSGDDVHKSTNVLSGGEKARCMFSKLMLTESNCLLFDEPTDHLDLESISALNEGLINFPGILLVSSHDIQLLNTVCNRVIEVTPKGMLDVKSTFSDFIENESIAKKRKTLY